MLVLTPTRELANQVAQVVDSLTDELRVVPVYGGSSITYQGYFHTLTDNFLKTCFNFCMKYELLMDQTI